MDNKATIIVKYNKTINYFKESRIPSHQYHEDLGSSSTVEDTRLLGETSSSVTDTFLEVRKIKNKTDITYPPKIATYWVRGLALNAAGKT